LVVAVLLGIGLVMMYSISPILSQKLTGSVDRNYYFLNQIKNIAAGLAVWVVAAMVPYYRWRDWAPALLGVAAVGMLALFIPGLAQSTNGATRWLQLGPIPFQPAELMKLALIIYLAAWLEHHREDLRSFKDGIVPYMIILGAVCFAVVVFQRDMGSMMVLATAGLGMYFVAGMSWAHLAEVLAAGAAAAWLAIIAFPHRLERLTTFLDSSHDTSGSGYHINQALIAVGSGGLTGRGLGMSIQVYGYLPEAANDSIFAIIAEEFGLIGSLVIIGLFAALCLRGLQMAAKAPDAFSRLLAAGISLWFLAQAFINMGAMMAILPLTGIPLPFISYGGTSLVVSLAAAGILVNISKYTVKEENDADSRQRRWNSRPRHAHLGRRRSAQVA
jgi:cell division protein FtsW